MHEIRLDHPSKNALGTALLNHILEGIRAGGGAPLLLSGRSDVFSAGFDLKEVVACDDARMLALLQLLERCMVALYTYPGPTVADVGSHAIAGGCVLAACCDHVVATTNERTKIGLNEVALGVRFPPKLLAILKQRVPSRHWSEVFLGAGLYGPADALRLGLVDELADDPSAVARARLAERAAHPPAAYRATKLDLRVDLSMSDADHERAIRDALPLWRSEELARKVATLLSRGAR